MKNEIFIQKNELFPMNKVYKACKSTIQIKYQKENKVFNSSGFFIKFQKNKKPFYCIMTNEHSIKNDMIINEELIIILYENKTKELEIKLNEKERLIKTFKDFEDFSLDITIIQIIEKDNIADDYFSLPDQDYLDKYDFLISEEIAIPQFPLGGVLQMSKGEIIGINYENNKYEFSHTASTLAGSSGSPIILKGKETVIGIHKGGNISKEENYGEFIGPIINIMNSLKRNGKGIEYYKNGEIKYEGNYVDDGDAGCYHYENGDIYIGQFKNGKKNGNGCIYDKNNNLKMMGEFLDDELINKENLDSDKDESEENNDSNSEKDNPGYNNRKKHDKEDNDSNDEKGNQDYKEGAENKNININNNIDNNDSNKNVNNNFYTIKTQLFHILHPLGNMVGMICTRCSHLTASHKAIEFGKWECNECKKDDNICCSKEDGI